MEREWGVDNATGRPPDEDRERVRLEFYATYDVMTGVRIAATLGGFFALMVFLIVYKSRSKSVKALRDPKIVEFAEAVVAEEEAVEEERRLTAALEDALAERGGREPRPPGARGARLSIGARRPSRRPSSGTCSSSGSSYLERRGSNVCALPDRRLSMCPGPGERLAPLASVGSAGATFAVECELASVGADSVFAEDDPDSTDDEIEQFSTDSGGGECAELAVRPGPRRVPHARSRETLF